MTSRLWMTAFAGLCILTTGALRAADAPAQPAEGTKAQADNADNEKSAKKGQGKKGAAKAKKGPKAPVDPKVMLAITDKAQAGPDYEVQGEYVGKIKEEEEIVTVGGQIVALGDGKFLGVAYTGGLPGAGWDGSERITSEGEAKDGQTIFKTEDGRTATVKDGVITVTSAEGELIGKLTKVFRKSRTLTEAPPKGAVVLFDGKSADAWEGGEMTEDGLLKVGTTSKQKFGDCVIHLEFMTPFMPYARGQQRGNSGVYLQHRYELQILDSFGLEGLDNECGGFYKVSAPKINACLPPLSWQTYDIDFTAARYEGDKKVKNAMVTVRHNGEVIHQDLELPDATAGGRKELPEPGPIFLQNHKNPVVFRNIWVIEK
ncbi:MAG: 3-keto-disaccharide hydrolase [Planctomycetota bacterium]